jgi:eukaryotic-like serine/threonine-protein kinase
MSEAHPPKRSWRVPAGREVVPGRRAIENLGGGRRTEVYRCADLNLGETVVVKVLRPGRTGENDVRVLAREAEVIGAVDHPGFPRLHAVDLDADPAYLVMSQAEGPHLSTLLRDYGHLELDQAIPLAVDVADALAHLHAAGYVHLDVKPRNIVMGERVVLIDLGTARSQERARRLPPRMGTITYMAPEQVDPATFGAPGPAADVFGLGMTLLRATTGANPLVARRHPETCPTEPTLVAACIDAAAAIPEPLQPVVTASLALDAADRPTAAEIVQLLEARPARPSGVLRRFAATMRGLSDSSQSGLTDAP